MTQSLAQFGRYIKRHILIVGSDTNIRDILVSHLDQSSFEITLVSAGATVLTLLENRVFDLILLDFSLSDIDGLKLLEKVRKRYRPNELPVIIVTHQDASCETARALEWGANDYITKPLNGKVVHTRVKTQLEISRLLNSVDSMTGLPDVNTFMEHLNQALDVFSQTGVNNFALCVLNLNDKRKIASALGPAGYEKLNACIAQRLSDVIHETGYFSAIKCKAVISQLTDNHFVILLENLVCNANGLLTAAQQIQWATEAPFTIMDHVLYCTLSIGITVPERFGHTCDDLIKQAMTAESQGRKSGKGMIHIHNTQQHVTAMAQFHLENELRAGIEKGELRAHFQPIVSLTTGLVVGSESLVRWQHPRRNLLAPFHFLTIAEDVGFINKIDAWMLHESCRQYMVWSKQCYSESMFISVNVSAKKIDQNWVDNIRALIGRVGVSPADIHLEITESIFMNDVERVIGLLNQLIEIGVSFAIDDFGTGYSCFSYLKLLPVSYLKVDKSFVDDIACDDRAETLLHSIINMGHSFGMKIIAEGVETEQQSQMLIDMGCDFGQGYYYGKPMAAADCNWIDKRKIIAPNMKKLRAG